MFLIFDVSGVNDTKLIVMHQIKKQLNVNERHLLQFRPSGVLGNYEAKSSALLLNKSLFDSFNIVL
jgi:hypothetical protein